MANGNGGNGNGSTLKAAGLIIAIIVGLVGIYLPVITGSTTNAFERGQVLAKLDQIELWMKSHGEQNWHEAAGLKLNGLDSTISELQKDFYVHTGNEQKHQTETDKRKLIRDVLENEYGLDKK